MLVILRENIENLGRIGDAVKVSDGYARNYLLPRNLVVAADEKNLAIIEHHKRSLEKKRLAQRASAEELAKKLNEFSCTITRKAGEHDKLFGSVNVGDIADALTAAGYSVEKRLIRLDNPIKSLGVHPVTIKLEPEVTATLKVWVVKEE
ncbi:MAG: 50S ribosomal protein L9 [Bdellovibrionales bacterium RIFOXYD1_FULL_55_31]|nr:MAG: 50S ribosomal protein L9 [Bdellovibrionales bacterium RIFOXYD1_FULL_55_31]